MKANIDPRCFKVVCANVSFQNAYCIYNNTDHGLCQFGHLHHVERIQAEIVFVWTRFHDGEPYNHRHLLFQVSI